MTVMLIGAAAFATDSVFADGKSSIVLCVGVTDDLELLFF